MTDFSVVVSTRNNPESLKTLLESIKDAKQKYNGKTEVIIIDDSDPSNRGLVHDAAIKYECRLQYYPGTCAQKKNKGAGMAAYKVVLFLDADISVRADIFLYYHQVFKDGATAVAGPVLHSGTDTYLWKSMRSLPFMRRYYQPMYLDQVSWGVTSNFAVCKNVFIEAGGLSDSTRSMDEESLIEEAELGIKLRSMNHKIATAPEATVYRPRYPWIKYKNMRRRLKKISRSEVALSERNPELKMKKSLNRNLMYLLAFMMTIFAALLFANPYLLIPGAAYYILENLSISIIMTRKDGYYKATFFQQLMIEHLIHIGERAHIFSCLKQLKFKTLNTRIVYYDKQIYSNFKMSRKMTFVQSILFVAFCASLLVLGIAA